MLNNLLAQSIDPCNSLDDKSLCNSSIFQPILENLQGGKLGVSTLTKLISSAAAVFLILIVSFSVISLLIAAWNMITDNGDGVNFKKGTSRFFYAIGGLVFALLSFALVSFVVRFLGRK